MKKVQRYTLINTDYFAAVDAVSTVFRQQEIPYAVVGGTAIQARLASLVCENGRTNIRNAVGLEALFRPTGDIDLTTRGDEGSILQAFNILTATYPKLDVQKRGERGAIVNSGGSKIHMSYQTGPEDLQGLTAFYDEILDSAHDVNVTLGNETAQFAIPGDTFLIVSKLLGKREKDEADLFNLLRTMKLYGVEVDLDEVEGTLKSINKGKKYDYIRKIIHDV